MMSDPREQAIKEIQNLYDRIPTIRDAVRSIITDYERTRARIDGAKMMPREATEAQLLAALSVSRSDDYRADDTIGGAIFRAMHDATPKDGLTSP